MLIIFFSLFYVSRQLSIKYKLNIRNLQTKKAVQRGKNSRLEQITQVEVSNIWNKNALPPRNTAVGKADSERTITVVRTSLKTA